MAEIVWTQSDCDEATRIRQFCYLRSLLHPNVHSPCTLLIVGIQLCRSWQPVIQHDRGLPLSAHLGRLRSPRTDRNPAASVNPTSLYVSPFHLSHVPPSESFSFSFTRKEQQHRPPLCELRWMGGCARFFFARAQEFLGTSPRACRTVRVKVAPPRTKHPLNAINIISLLHLSIIHPFYTSTPLTMMPHLLICRKRRRESQDDAGFEAFLRAGSGGLGRLDEERRNGLGYGT